MSPRNDPVKAREYFAAKLRTPVGYRRAIPVERDRFESAVGQRGGGRFGHGRSEANDVPHESLTENSSVQASDTNAVQQSRAAE